MKRFAGVVAIISLFLSTPVSGLTGVVSDPNAPLPLENVSVLISAFSANQTLDFVEINNQSDKAVDVSGWYVRVITTQKTTGVISEADIRLPDGWLLSDSYITLGRDSLVNGADAVFGLEANTNESVNQIELYTSEGALVHKVTLSTAFDVTKWYQRKTGASGLSDTFADFTAKTGAGVLRGDGMYRLPSLLSGVRIVELHARPRDCGPSDTSLLCRDYIKLFNDLDTAVDLSNYRLKTDSGTSVSGNTFHLGSIGAKSYLTVWQRDDGAPLSLTNDGGYAWFEDAEGVVRYDESVTSWPDSSSDTKQGQAWAVNEGGEWQWTPTPQPDSSNLFPVAEVAGLATSELAPCPAGKYHSLETNRCRTVEEAIAVLAACDLGEVRNPETNRCRKAATLATAELTPCSAGQERNPETNRCRSVTAITSDDPKPCREGEERNPATNRCRKVASSSTQVATFTDPPATKSTMSVPILAAVFTVAIGYAVYEWRRELAKGLAWAVAKIKY